MSSELFFRSEDLTQEEVLTHLVETDSDRKIVDSLKGRSPVILRGSRGVGKSFLMRVAEVQLSHALKEQRVLPVYVTFARASLIAKPTPERFQAWMLAKICNRLIRAAASFGFTLPAGSSIKAIRGTSSSNISRLEAIEAQLEESWKGVESSDDLTGVPDVDVLKDAVEDLCDAANLRRVNLFIDEAAHVFIPEQQRQFFTLMRDLRSPYIAVKAAVYPGATAFGESFQMTHDATEMSVDRPIVEDDYARSMREIVYKQDDGYRKIIAREGEAFDTLAFAATGNPRILLKTLSRSTPLNRRRVQEVVKSYYREEIWSEHSKLAERYPGHRQLIDWGRSFMEGNVLPALFERNEGRPHETSSHIWIHRDAPEVVREALRLLCYSGILQEGVSGIRATRSEIGTRYMVNLGCQFALAKDPVVYGTEVRRLLSIKRMVEFGANHPAFRAIQNFSLDGLESSNNEALRARLEAPASKLDVTQFQHKKLGELGLKTIGQVLAAGEDTFKKAHYVGPTRARQMRNAAVAAVLEYLSG
ncbi:hypothetical protein SAMN05421835_13530 [Amycolatopsis sacchari]|uniref:AAA ATPase domain-containing protein n=1 Tax=Amycolatopsis sacchari TaxID=115433 RepID=A0A1I4CMG1_9PSEU|nr:hypothetical protein [Amycolatopsis sacchari]SFK81121.1 hypothetical protein SAMN05421835_13530 [Amycolatopsis sacchari]